MILLLLKKRIMLGFEARKALQNVYQNNDCSGRCWIKAFNKVEAPRIDDLIIHSKWSYHLVYKKIHSYKDHLKDFFNRSSVQPLAVSTQSSDNRISSWTLIITREREEKGEFLIGLHGHLYYDHSPPIYRIWESKIFHEKPLYLCPYLPTPIDPLLSSDVNKLLNFWSKHQMQLKTLNQIFKTPSHQEQMILSSSMNEKIYL